MRVLIGFLLLCCFHFSTACASRNTTASVTKKSVTKVHPIFDKVAICSTSTSHSLQKEPFAEHVNRIHQTQNHQYNLSLFSFDQGGFGLTNPPLQTIQFFNGQANYSYQFIFNCLYPKHTFW